MSQRILIVEDIVPSRDALVRLLQREGYETVIASNGADALARLKKGTPDLIMLDHMMPEVDGLTFLAGIRRFPKWRNLPVIMLSGLKDPTAVNKAEALGVCAYVIKAETSALELLEYIRKYTRQPQPS